MNIVSALAGRHEHGPLTDRPCQFPGNGLPRPGARSFFTTRTFDEPRSPIRTPPSASTGLAGRNAYGPIPAVDPPGTGCLSRSAATLR